MTLMHPNITAETMTKGRQATKDAKAALDAELRVALHEAHTAGLAAAREFVKRAEIDEDVCVRDICGRASLKSRRSKWSFSQRPQATRPRSPGVGRLLADFSFLDEGVPVSAIQSIRAHEAACEAARIVMRAHFPEENSYVLSRAD
jgi:hypothetical protein